METSRITNFYLSSIQMVVWYLDHLDTGPVFKRWSEYQTKYNPVFKWHSNTRLFGDCTTFNHLNTRLVLYSDSNCTGIQGSGPSSSKMKKGPSRTWLPNSPAFKYLINQDLGPQIESRGPEMQKTERPKKLIVRF